VAKRRAWCAHGGWSPPFRYMRERQEKQQSGTAVARAVVAAASRLWAIRAEV